MRPTDLCECGHDALEHANDDWICGADCCDCEGFHKPESRPSWDQTFMEMAVTLSERSTCQFRKVGALFVVDKHPIIGGYNGSPRGEPHCCDGHTLLDTDGETCLRCAHAEMNCIYWAARQGGTALAGSTIYVTCRLCARCEIGIISVGAVRVVHLGDGPASSRLKDSGILVERLDK